MHAHDLTGGAVNWFGAPRDVCLGGESVLQRAMISEWQGKS